MDKLMRPVQTCIAASVTCCIVAHLLASVLCSCLLRQLTNASGHGGMEHLKTLPLHAVCKRGPAVFWLCGGRDGQRRMPGHYQLFRGQHERDVG